VKFLQTAAKVRDERASIEGRSASTPSVSTEVAVEAFENDTYQRQCAQYDRAREPQTQAQTSIDSARWKARVYRCYCPVRVVSDDARVSKSGVESRTLHRHRFLCWDPETQ